MDEWMDGAQGTEGFSGMAGSQPLAIVSVRVVCTSAALRTKPSPYARTITSYAGQHRLGIPFPALFNVPGLAHRDEAANHEAAWTPGCSIWHERGLRPLADSIAPPVWATESVGKPRTQGGSRAVVVGTTAALEKQAATRRSLEDKAVIPGGMVFWRGREASRPPMAEFNVDDADEVRLPSQSWCENRCLLSVLPLYPRTGHIYLPPRRLLDPSTPADLSRCRSIPAYHQPRRMERTNPGRRNFY